MSELAAASSDPLLNGSGASGILLAMFSAAVLDHFQNPRNAGELPDATATVEVSNPVCGDVMRLSVRVTARRIVAVRFKTRGCVTAIAAGSLLTELMQGKLLQEVSGITPEQISETLGGLPPATAHGSQLAHDGLTAILAELASKRAR